MEKSAAMHDVGGVKASVVCHKHLVREDFPASHKKWPVGQKIQVRSTEQSVKWLVEWWWAGSFSEVYGTLCLYGVTLKEGS